MKQHLWILILFMATLSVNAQRKRQKTDNTEIYPDTVVRHARIKAITKGYEDSVVVRWAPADPLAWTLANKAGYHITRIDLSQPGNPVKTDLTPQGIFPTPDKSLKGVDTSTQEGKYLAIAEKMLYGDEYSISRTLARSFTAQLKNEHSALFLRYLVSTMIADYDPPAATALGLRYVDRQVQKGGKYIYEITCPYRAKNYVFDSANILAVNIRKTVPVPRGLEAAPRDHKTELQWDRLQQGNFSAYFIERSDDGGKTWHERTRGPYNATYIPPGGDPKKDSLLSTQNSQLKNHQIFTDSLPRNYYTYYYRLRGINGFGELSPYTTVLSIQGKDLTPPSTAWIDSARNTTGRSIKIWWKKTKMEADFAGYYINRGTSAKGPFSLVSARLLEKGVTTFTDTAALAHASNFYVVIAVDTAGNATVSAPAMAFLKDTVAPHTPVGVTGTIDSSGIVHLHWSSNREDDLDGYQVYSSYNADGRYSQITKGILTDTSFTDSVATRSLDRRVYYRLVALDRNFNHSPMSATAVLRKVVVVPPSAPLAGQVSEDARGIHIEWIESRSEGAMGYQVYRKEAGKDWQPLQTLSQDWSAPSVRFTDSAIRPNTDYFYAAETIDSTGVHSIRSLAVRANDHERSAPAPVSKVQASFDQKTKTIQISWQPQGTPQASDYFFVVYRAVNDGPLNTWQSFDKTARSCRDNGDAKMTYRYAVQVVCRNPDGVSPLSTPVTVHPSL
jgi:uncharacterized protein